MKKLKLIIGVISLILMTSLFMIFNDKNVSALTSDPATIKMEVSETTLTPGSEFTIKFTWDLGRFSDEDFNINAVNIDLFFEEDAPFSWNTVDSVYYKYDFIGTSGEDYYVDKNDLTMVYNRYQLGYLNAGLAYIGKTPLLTSDVRYIILTCYCIINDNIDDDNSNFTLDFGGPEDRDSGVMLDYEVWGFNLEGVEYLLDNYDDLQLITININDKYKTNKINNIEVTGNSSEYWTGEENIIDKTLEVSADTTSVNLDISCLENASIYSVSPGNGSNGSYTIPLNDTGQNTDITIKIIAEKASDYTPGSDEYNSYIKEYTFTISRGKYDISTLDDLSFNLPNNVDGNISLDKTFSSSDLSYILSIPDGVSSIVVNPIITSGYNIVGVTYNGNSLTSGSNNTIDISGKNSLEFIVSAQDGSTTTYTVALNKLSNDNTIKNLTVDLIKTDNSTETINVKESNGVYNASVSYTNALGFSIDADKNDSNATIAFNPTSKTQTFASGYNADTKSIVITVTSQSGIIKTYTVSITREAADEDVNFTYTVNGTNTGNLYNAEINGNDWAYYLPETEGSASITINGLASTTNATGTATSSELSIGNTRYTLTITPENANKAVTYNIYIYKQLDTDNTLSNIEILDKEGGNALSGINFSFKSNITDDYTYTTITVPYNVSSVYIDANATSSKATVYGGGTQSLTSGNTKTIEVYAISEYDRSNNTGVIGYKHIIKIERSLGDSNAYLTSLKFNGVEFEDLTNTITNVIYRVEHDTTSVEITATACDNANISSSSTAIGTKSLNIGKNDYTITIIAQDNTTNTIYVTIYRAEDKATITNININGLDYTFNADNKNIELSVSYDISSLTFDVNTNGTYATIYGNGKQDLSVGRNTITIYATSEYYSYNNSLGMKSETYTFIITKEDADTDNSLDSLSLTINNNEYIIDFNKEQTTYTIVLPSTFDLVNNTTGEISASLPNNSKATIESGTGTVNLPTSSLDDKVYTIIVKSQAGVSKSYIITIKVAQGEASNNSNMSSISAIFNNFDYLNGVSLEDILAAGTSGYTVNLGFNVSGITLTGIAEDSTATVIGNSSYSLNYGDDVVYCVYVIAANGEIGNMYYIRFIVEVPNTDAYLINLTFNGSSYDDLTSTTSNVIYRVEHNIDYITIDANACNYATISSSSTAIGNKALNVGKNEFTITVIAQDTSIANTIYITIYRAEDDSSITNISISDLDYTFDNDTNRINITVPYAKSFININVSTNATYATIYGNGNHVINVGDNTITIYVISEYYNYSNGLYGTKSSEYTFIITRQAADTNAYLNDLYVNINNEKVDFETEFNKDKLVYSLIVSNNVTSIYVVATPKSDKATVSPTGTISLDSGTIVDGNTIIITIKVTAEDISIYKEYLIYVSRDGVDLSDNNEILNISVIDNDNNEYINNYNSSILTYNITVPYSVSSVYVVASKPELAGSTIYGNGVYNLTAGEIKVITIYAVSELGNQGSVYTINITRKTPDSNSKLEYIKINGSLIDGFNNELYRYNISVVYNTSSVDITAKALSDSSNLNITINNISNTGLNITLDPGAVTTVQILVKAENGDISTYTVNISRAAADGMLSILYIEGVNFIDNNGNIVNYSPDTLTYYAEVSYVYSSINIIATASDPTCEVRGSGVQYLEVGIQNFQIAAIPTSGNVTVYTLTILRKAEVTNNTNVDKFEISEITGFDEIFTNTSNIYKNLSVPSYINKLSFNIDFDVEEFGTSPTYEILGNELTFGTNIVIVSITSADLSSVRNILLTVIREDVNVIKVDSSIDKFNSDFSNELDNYSYNVGKNTKVFNVTLDLENSEYDSYTVSTTSLKSGLNTIEITLNSSDEFNRTIYVNIYRRTSSSSSSSTVDYILVVIVVVLLGSGYFIFKKKEH